jgi:phenylpyruvate tautomerase PptA (4-oxalocrotonate tautomerase family)
MPVVHVRASRADADIAEEALVRIAEAVAEATPCDLESVWCTFGAVDVETLGDRVVEDEGRIVYVDVWIRPRDDAAAAVRALEAVCRSAATGFGVPVEDVWGTLRPVEPMKVFAGGALIDEP